MPDATRFDSANKAAKVGLAQNSVRRRSFRCVDVRKDRQPAKVGAWKNPIDRDLPKCCLEVLENRLFSKNRDKAGSINEFLARPHAVSLHKYSSPKDL